MKLNRNIYLIAASPLLFPLALAAQPQAPVPLRDIDWRAKVSPALLAQSGDGPVEFFILLFEQADLSGAARLTTPREKGAFVFSRLHESARRTQAGLISQLRARGVVHQSYWVTNMILARGDARLIESLARRPEVARIHGNTAVHIQAPELGDSGITRAPSAVEWNVSKIRAPDVWVLGYTGQGAVVASADTGVQWNHPALINHYRGWNGTAADHNYHWHDAIHTGGGVCGADSPLPCDDYGSGHGSHTVGTMTGDDGAGNQTGVAPGAKWIACRNMNVGNGTVASYSECFQWFIAPTDLNNQNPDPARAPAAVNNSWICDAGEGCADPDILLTVVQNVRAAGILVTAAAGNFGPACSTVNNPPGIYAPAFTAGATDIGDLIAPFSSRGPVTVDGSNRRKPDISAPGANVRSAATGGGYIAYSGTSMAAPHAAGLAALLLSARPDFSGRVDLLEYLISRTAVGITTTEGCGGDTPTAIPNNTYGRGRIDALSTLTGDPDGDTVSTLTDCEPADGSLWAPPTEARALRLLKGAQLGLNWTAPVTPGGTTVRYDILRSPVPNEFITASATACVVSNTGATSALDPGAPGSAFYLVRARNGCGGTLGTNSAGVPISGRSCP